MSEIDSLSYICTARDSKIWLRNSDQKAKSEQNLVDGRHD